MLEVVSSQNNDLSAVYSPVSARSSVQAEIVHIHVDYDHEKLSNEHLLIFISYISLPQLCSI